jgi:hypothetical protein
VSQIQLFLISIYLFITMAGLRSATEHIQNLPLGKGKLNFKFIGSFNKLHKMRPQKAPNSIGHITPLSNPIFECQHNSVNPSKGPRSLSAIIQGPPVSFSFSFVLLLSFFQIFLVWRSVHCLFTLFN